MDGRATRRAELGHSFRRFGLTGNNQALYILDYSQNHRDLVEACKCGSRSAQFELYSLYSKAMFNTALRMVERAADAEDVLQSAFTEAFMKLESFRYESSFGAWIKRIVINKSINFLKSRRDRFVEMTREAAEPFEDKSTEHDPRWTVEKIHGCIAELPDGYRVVFSLYALEGYDHEEIGEILGISEQTSKSQFSRAKARLREMLMSI